MFLKEISAKDKKMKLDPTFRDTSSLIQQYFPSNTAVKQGIYEFKMNHALDAP